MKILISNYIDEAIHWPTREAAKIVLAYWTNHYPELTYKIDKIAPSDFVLVVSTNKAILGWIA